MKSGNILARFWPGGLLPSWAMFLTLAPLFEEGERISRRSAAAKVAGIRLNVYNFLQAKTAFVSETKRVVFPSFFLLLAHELRGDFFFLLSLSPVQPELIEIQGKMTARWHTSTPTGQTKNTARSTILRSDVFFRSIFVNLKLEINQPRREILFPIWKLAKAFVLHTISYYSIYGGKKKKL